MELLSHRHASERIALFLHGFCERLRRGGQSGADFKLPMSREDIAHFLGLALETVSRGFTRLQDDGLISVNSRWIELPDVGSSTGLYTGLPTWTRVRWDTPGK